MINNNIAQTTTAVKPAAIWARVSTTSQAETSLPSQVSRCQERLQQAGYTPIRIFSIDWGSLDLYSCPEFQELRRLVSSGEIEALCVYDRDRLAAAGLQRLTFMADLKDHGVELLVCSGPELLDSPEGQIVELALAIGKERSVLRARQGSKDGLADRATKRHLPVTFHKVYGYTWDKVNIRLMPDSNYATLKLIFQMLLEGKGYLLIVNELEKRGIPAPSGNSKWNIQAISHISHNPIYSGRYFALKKEAVAPKKRNGSTYGNTSTRRKQLSEAAYIPEITIIDPPITWEQRGILLDQILQHQKLSSRHAKRDYLLRGMIFCEEHGRRYHGRPKRETFYYACPVGGCDHPYLDGESLDYIVKNDIIARLYSYKKDDLFEQLTQKKNKEKTADGIKAEIDKLEKELDQLLNKMAKLEDTRLAGSIDIEVYERLKLQYKSRRAQIADSEDYLLNKIAALNRGIAALESWEELKAKYLGRMQYVPENMLDEQLAGAISKDSNPLTTQEWQDILTRLNFEIHVMPNKQEYDDRGADSDWIWNLNLSKRKQGERLASEGKRANARIELSLPLKADAIASAHPERG